MSNEDPNEQQDRHDPYAQQYGGWQPTPQSGEYDAEATAFVHLPPEDLANDPLAAPGHGYVPPMILPLTPAAGLDPAATGSWAVQMPDTRSPDTRSPDEQAGREHLAPSSVHWPDPNQYPVTSSTTAQWDFSEATNAAAEPTAGSGAVGHTGQWTIPVAEGDLPEESGEFAASALASQWYTDTAPPATLPGGAPAPWATQHQEETEAAPPAVDETVDEAGQETADEAPREASERPAEFPEAPSAAEFPGHPEGAEDAEATDAAAPGLVSAPETAAPPTDAPAGHEPGEAPAAGVAATPVTGAPSEHPSASYVLHVNGADRPVSEAWIGESLLYVLRERLGLAGAKDGCSQGECGACNVQVDGRLVASCLVPAATAAGSEVRTVEGLAVDGEPSDVQRALAACGAVQCGFCIPGMAMTIHDLLEGNHAPSELETRQALCGNLCRCSGYRGVLDAVGEVIAGREANAEAAASEQTDDARIPHQARPGAGSFQPQPHEGGDL